MMKLTSQITVFLENQPGAMARVCRLIKNKGINIEAFTVFGTVDHGVLRLIVNEPGSVLNILAQDGLLAISSNVIEIPSKSSPGYRGSPGCSSATTRGSSSARTSTACNAGQHPMRKRKRAVRSWPAARCGRWNNST